MQEPESPTASIASRTLLLVDLFVDQLIPNALPYKAMASSRSGTAIPTWSMRGDKRLQRGGVAFMGHSGLRAAGADRAPASRGSLDHLRFGRSRRSVIVAGARMPMGRLLGLLKGLSCRTRRPRHQAALEQGRRLARPGRLRDHGSGHPGRAGQNAARQASVAGGIGMDVPALTINKVCLSGINAIALADQLIRAGEYDVVVAGAWNHDPGPSSVAQEPFGASKYGDVAMLDATAYDALHRRVRSGGHGSCPPKGTTRSTT